MFAVGLVLIVVGWLICKVGDNPVYEIVNGSATNTKVLGGLLFLIGLLLMTASVALLAWQHMP